MKYEFWKEGIFAEKLLSKISVNKPLMFDTETIGLYGRIRLAQFYQDTFDVPILVEYPDVYELIQVLNQCIVVCHSTSYDISTIQEALGKVQWQPKELEDTFLLSRLKFYGESKFSFNKCVEYALGHDPYNDLPDTKKTA